MLQVTRRYGPWVFEPELNRLRLDDMAAAETWDGPPTILLPEIGDAESIVRLLANVCAVARRPHRDLGARADVAQVLGWLVQAVLSLSWGGAMNGATPG